MRKKSKTEIIVGIAWDANRDEYLSILETLKVIYQKRFGTAEKLAKKIRTPKAQPLQEAV